MIIKFVFVFVIQDKTRGDSISIMISSMMKMKRASTYLHKQVFNNKSLFHDFTFLASVLTCMLRNIQMETNTIIIIIIR